MNRRQTIALVAGTVVTVIVFVAAMWLLVFGGVFLHHNRLVMVSIALGPVAMLSVMVGFAIWWLAMFLLTLMSHSDNSDDRH